RWKKTNWLISSPRMCLRRCGPGLKTWWLMRYGRRYGNAAKSRNLSLSWPPSKSTVKIICRLPGRRCDQLGHIGFKTRVPGWGKVRPRALPIERVCYPLEQSGVEVDNCAPRGCAVVDPSQHRGQIHRLGVT